VHQLQFGLGLPQKLPWGKSKVKEVLKRGDRAVNLLLDQVNMNDSMDDMYHEIEDNDGNPIYRGPLDDEHEDKFEMSSDESDVEDGFDSDSQGTWISKEPIIQPKQVN
jgi:hypothetical protein